MEDVVEELVLVVPEVDVVSADLPERAGNRMDAWLNVARSQAIGWRATRKLADYIAATTEAAANAMLLAKIDRVMLECLGSSYAAAANERFDLDAATAGLMLYEARDIPCVPTPLPDGVLSARLYVDVAFVPTTDPATLSSGVLAQLPFA